MTFAAPPLLAIAHGSRDARAAATIGELLDRVWRHATRRGLVGLQIATAYLGHAAPSPAQALSALHGTGARRIIALPLLLTDAYHTKTDIPAALGSARASLPRLQIRYAAPLGPNPLLITAMERRLAEVGIQPGGPHTAVVLAAAGSSDPAASAAIAQLARDWQALRHWHEVMPAFASAASPTPAEAVTALRDSGVTRVAVASYLLAPGVFADQVRDTCMAAGATKVSEVLGAAPELADVVLRRYADTILGLPHAPQARIA